MQVDCRTSLQMCAAPDIHTLCDGRTFLPLYLCCAMSFMQLISTFVSKHLKCFVFPCHKNDTSTLSLLRLDIVTYFSEMSSQTSESNVCMNAYSKGIAGLLLQHKIFCKTLQIVSFFHRSCNRPSNGKSK